MTRVGSITVRKQYVKAPVHIQHITENGISYWAKFKAIGFIDHDHIKFIRTDECTSGLKRQVGE